MNTQRTGDIASGILLILLSVVVIAAALQIKGAPDVRMQPRTLPLILGWTVGIAGGVLALRAWRYRGPARSVAWPDGEGARRIGVTLAGLAAFLVCIPPLGFPIGAGLLVTFLTWYLGRYKVVYPVLLGLATSATIYVVFIRLLELSFPVGPLGR
jgi:putative tricarboxylic transport membrane protein